MPIPPFEQSGLLPPGVHGCTLEEIKLRFGSFQSSDRRPLLFLNLEKFVTEARASGIVRNLIVNGSFVTAETAPNDIDLIVIVPSEHDFTIDLSPGAYNVLPNIGCDTAIVSTSWWLGKDPSSPAVG